MTDDEKWHAVATKDPKTDGKFYYAVKTTEGNIAPPEPVSKLKGPVTDCTLSARHLSGCHLPEGFKLSRSSCRSRW